MKTHKIKDYIMLELANNAIITPHIETDIQTEIWMILKYSTNEYWYSPDWQEPWRIYWRYDQGEGLFYGTDREFNQLTRWIDAELQTLISDDL